MEEVDARPGSAAQQFHGPFFQWTPTDEPFSIEAADPAYWTDLRRRYDPTHSSAPMRRLLEVAQELGAQTVVTEYRYIDSDYRSEHAAFYSSTFVRYPSVCHRLHFIRTEVSALEDLDDLPDDAHLGYAVMRPLAERPVGRTLMRPPVDGSYCWGEERIHVVGRDFVIKGMPYISQDAQYTRCAHSTMWMVLRHASLTAGIPKRTPSEIHLATSGGRVVGRNTPSDGLSAEQVLSGLHKLGCSAASFDLTRDGDESIDDDSEQPRKSWRKRRSALDPEQEFANRLRRLLVPYINSQIPTLIYSERHIWVVVGYRKIARSNGTFDIRYFIHDDSEGLYLEIDPLDDPGARTPWTVAIPPMPTKLYLNAERAEILGRDVFQGSDEKAATAALDLLLPPDESDIGDKEFKALRRMVDHVKSDSPQVTPEDRAEVEAIAAIVIEALREDPERLAAQRRDDEEVDLFVSQIEALEKLRSLTESPSLRTYAIDAQRFKKGTLGRVPPEISRAYRLLNLPRYVWVVEYVDSTQRAAGDPDVIGEVLLDGTAHQLAEPGSAAPLLAVHLWGVCTTHTVDHLVSRTTVGPISAPYRSGCAENRISPAAPATL